jgi:8-oxo-dGTP pyrophosphatase MutT (NUDIX family)
MATFVKKQGGINYYQIDGYRAAGIIPYFKRDNEYYILINKEYRCKKLKYHFLGGKVDLKDNSIYDTALREANEECGLLINSLIPKLYRSLVFEKNQFIKISKSKYISYLINIENYNTKHWLNLPILFKRVFKNNPYILKHNESVYLTWVKLSDLEKNVGDLSYLAKILILKLKQRLNIAAEHEDTFLDV